MSNTLLDNRSWRKISSPVRIGGVGSEEPHVVSFSTNHKSELGFVFRSTNVESGFSESPEFLSVQSVYVKIG
jgi:hypothetical protein